MSRVRVVARVGFVQVVQPAAKHRPQRLRIAKGGRHGIGQLAPVVQSEV
ncbi:hypothetical protein [Chloracidobacterium validum]